MSDVSNSTSNLVNQSYVYSGSSSWEIFLCPCRDVFDNIFLSELNGTDIVVHDGHADDSSTLTEGQSHSDESDANKNDGHRDVVEDNHVSEGSTLKKRNKGKGKALV